MQRMTRLVRIVGVALMAVMCLAAPGWAQQSVKFAIVTELTGAISGPGTNWKDAILMAVEEMNAKGGVLGRKIETSVEDTQSDPPTSVAVMRRALNDKPFVIMGTVFSSNTMANMHLAQQAGAPQITGSEAAVITQKDNPNIFRTSFTQAFGMAKVAKWMAEDLKADKVAVMWANTAFGKGGRDTFVKEWEARGKKVLVDVSTELKQADFTAELTRVKNSGATTLFLYLHEDESARLMTQLRKMGLPFESIVGETTLCTQQTIDLAKEALEGVKCHVGLTPDAALPGMREFAQKFQARTGRPADHNALKGYTGAYMVKATVEASGEWDQEKFRACLHGLSLETAKEPGLLMDLYMDKKGDLDRQSFMVEVKGGKQVVVKPVPMLGGPYPKKSCR